MKRICLTAVLALTAHLLWAQRSEMQKLPLTDMSAFRAQAGNWSIVGDVLVNPYVDIHEKPAPSPPEVEVKGKKKKKKKKNDTPPLPPPPPLKAVAYQAGTGILLNMNDDVKKDHLLTAWEHGDIILELDVMMPKGSNSGVYLQGRYEVQLLDSWGVKNPGFGDIGGIYRNWETEPGTTYMGKAPSTNAAKAPGLWQHLRIAFQAPRFDAAGNKIANARFVYVDLNGVRIHENYEVPLPTGGPIEKNEAAKGPLMIQGDHGPVAFRNIQYQLLEEKNITLSDIQYKLWKGEFSSPEAYLNTEPTQTGSLLALTSVIDGGPERFGVHYTGNIEVEEDGVYDLRFDYTGGASIKIGEKVIDWEYAFNRSKPIQLQLKKGKTPFEIQYVRNSNWWPNRLGLFNFGSFANPLHAYSSYASANKKPSAIHVKVGNRPRLLRAFLDFKGDKKQRLTHTIGVGGTTNAHFIYDLKAGTPVCMWRGEFIDATPMWHSRGDASFRSQGAVQYFFTGPSIAPISLVEPFPTEALDESKGFKNKGYRIDKTTGFPVFQYALDSFAIQDFIVPDATGNAFTRTVSIDTEAGEPTSKKFYVKIADAEQTEQLPDGTYVVDKAFYVKAKDGTALISRALNGKTEVMVMTKDGEASYTVMW